MVTTGVVNSFLGVYMVFMLTVYLLLFFSRSLSDFELSVVLSGFIDIHNIFLTYGIKEKENGFWLNR
jgi:hypothetical protein